ncbi:ras-GEF domain-containing family member 1C [Choloepus didactylus]|uniref:ras-GEF domain-containing family member 1C n=1 Tax=Choloepus didactylus TaxID=27675 RepID=UPI00189CAE2F|nr:ras-GEF domain-containing family member 1C [Choloepus didactylus]
MPQTLSPSASVSPGSCGPSPTEPTGGPQAGQPLLEGAPSSASLDTLIQHLVPTADYCPEKTFIFSFLLSSRLFIEPRELVARVCRLCVEQQQLNAPALDKARVRKFGPKLLQLLAEWTETFPWDFQEEATIGHVKDVLGRVAACDEAYRKRMHQLLQALHQKLVAPGRRPEGLVGTDTPVSSRPKPLAAVHRELLSLCSDPYTLAQQLTCVELEQLRHIGPEEFVQAFVNKDPLAGAQPRFSDKTHNLEAYVKWFNRLCYLVATEICVPSKKQRRAQVIEFSIDVARERFSIGNFSSLMAVVSGMNMSPVSRLKRTWARVKTAKFFILEHQMDPTGNFCNYRTALRGAAHWSLTARSSQEKVVVPFFSLFIKDTHFPSEGCASRLPNGHVTLRKPPLPSQLGGGRPSGLPSAVAGRPHSRPPCGPQEQRWADCTLYPVTPQAHVSRSGPAEGGLLSLSLSLCKMGFDSGLRRGLGGPDHAPEASGPEMLPLEGPVPTPHQTPTCCLLTPGTVRAPGTGSGETAELQGAWGPCSGARDTSQAWEGGDKTAERGEQGGGARQLEEPPVWGSMWPLLAQNPVKWDFRVSVRGLQSLLPRKFLELAKQVGEFISWKQVECPFDQDPSVTQYLLTAPMFSEDGLYLASYERESPENQTEKERWKSLRGSILGKT